MSDLAINNYFCVPPKLVPAGSGITPAQEAATAKAEGCIPFQDDPDAYFQVKIAQATLMDKILNDNKTDVDLEAEAYTIRWLIGRELGNDYILRGEEGQGKLFTKKYKIGRNVSSLLAILKKPGLYSTEERAQMVMRVRFWQAKIALILIGDIDNPDSRRVLKLLFQGAPGLAVKFDDKNAYSNAEKLALLKELYKHLPKLYEDLLPGMPRDKRGDPLLEAECLLAQYELRASDPTAKLEPSQDLKYLKDLLTRVTREMKNGGGKTYYIHNRIPDQGNIPRDLRAKGGSSKYWKGDAVRFREANRYQAQAQVLQVRLTLLETGYRSPDFEKNMTGALKLLFPVQTLVNEYGDNPKEINNALKLFGAEANHSLDKYGKPYGDLLNLLSIDYQKAEINYRLGLYYQNLGPGHNLESKTRFNAAKVFAENIETVLQAISNRYSKFEINPTENSYLLRSTLLGQVKALQANILLARNENQKENLELALPLLREDLASTKLTDLKQRLVLGESVARLRLTLADALLRQRTRNKVDKTTQKSDEAEKIAAAKLVLAPLVDELKTAKDQSPYAARLKGPIKLMQAKLKLAEFHLSELDEGLAKEAINILGEIIPKPESDGPDKGHYIPTKLDWPADSLPYHGLLEDYELSFALQTRAEAKSALGDFPGARADFEGALEVYQLSPTPAALKADPNARGKSLNYFALAGQADLANWSGNYADTKQKDGTIKKGALTLYAEIEKGYDLPSGVKDRISLGQAEAALRQKTLVPETICDSEADKVIAKARRIMTDSDELPLIERSLQSLVEALVAKKRAGQKELESLRDKLFTGKFDLAAYLGKEPKLSGAKPRDYALASLQLSLADAFQFVYQYKEGKNLLADFRDRFPLYFDKSKDNLIRPHYLLSSAELDLRLNQNDDKAADNIRQAAREIFALKGDKRDPYLTERAVKDLIDINVNEDNFAEALAIAELALGGQKAGLGKGLAKLDGIITPEQSQTAVEKAGKIWPDTLKMELVFKNKGLDKKWDIFALDLRIKKAEIMVWTRNFEPAAKLLAVLTQDSSATSLQKARVQLALGNIAAQSRVHRDFEQALGHYETAVKMIEEMKAADHGQELILVKTELYANLANVHRYGRGVDKQDKDIKDLDRSLHYYRLALPLAEQIKGNDDLKNYHLARINLGLAKIAEEQGHLVIDGREYWPSDLLAEAQTNWGSISEKGKKKFANEQLKGELKINDQNLARDWDSPNFQLTTRNIHAPRGLIGSSAEEMRLTLKGTESLTFDLWGGRHEVAMVGKINMDSDLNSGSTQETAYLGLQAKPFYWLSAEADYRLGSRSQLKPDFLLQYLSNPTLQLSLDLRAPGDAPFIRGLSSTVAADVFLPTSNDKGADYRNSFYGNLFYNFGRDFTNPFVQAGALGVQANQFGFFYNGDLLKRFRLSPTAKYEIDLKELDYADHSGWLNGMWKFKVEASLIREWADNPARYNNVMTTFKQDNLGFAVGADMQFNSLPWPVLNQVKANIFINYENIYQDLQNHYYLDNRQQTKFEFGLGLSHTF